MTKPTIEESWVVMLLICGPPPPSHVEPIGSRTLEDSLAYQKGVQQFYNEYWYPLFGQESRSETSAAWSYFYAQFIRLYSNN